MDSDRRLPAVILVLAAIVSLLAVWRSSFGITYLDDATYVATPLRLAQGAVPLADEVSLQAFGYLPAVPAAWLWHALFGATAIVLALRVFYVVLAALVAIAVFRLTVGTLGRVPAAVAAAVPLLAPPYAILSVSYNTSAQLTSVLMLALCIAALDRTDWRLAAGAGAAGALTALFYPPLVFAVIAAGLAFAVVARKQPRLAFAALACGVAVAAAAGLWLVLVPGIATVRESLGAAAAERPSSWLIAKLAVQGGALLRSLAKSALWPMWMLAVLSVALPRRTRAWALAALPLAAGVPGLLHLARGDAAAAWGAQPATWLFTLTLAALGPVVWRAATGDDRRSAEWIAIALAFAVVGVPTVFYATASKLSWGVLAVGITPLAAISVALLVGGVWSESNKAGTALSAISAVAVALVLLFSVSFKELPPYTLTTRVATGAAKGIATSAERAAEIADAERELPRFVTAGDRVLVLGAPLGYLIADAVPHTSSIWIPVGEPNTAAIAYFEREGSPDVVLVSVPALGDTGRPEKRATPLMSWIDDRYRPAGEAGRFAIYVRNEGP